jgi:hypothetical protein
MGSLIFRLAVLALAMLKPVQAPSDPFKVLEVDTGPDTKMEGRRVEVVQDANRWRLTYMDHLEISTQGPPPAFFEVPKVDFKKNVVLVVALGVASQTEGYEVVGTDQDAEAVHLRLAPIASKPGAPINVASSPYGFYVLPRFAKPLQVHLGRRIRNQVEWPVLATFEPTLVKAKV